MTRRTPASSSRRVSTPGPGPSSRWGMSRPRPASCSTTRSGAVSGHQSHSGSPQSHSRSHQSPSRSYSRSPQSHSRSPSHPAGHPSHAVGHLSHTVTQQVTQSHSRSHSHTAGHPVTQCSHPVTVTHSHRAVTQSQHVSGGVKCQLRFDYTVQWIIIMTQSTYLQHNPTLAVLFHY